jgi:Sugar (and other) transporter
VKPWGKRAIFGMLLAAVGISTYWCVAVGAQDMVQEFLIRHGYAPAAALSRAQFAYGFLINGGGFLGALSFGSAAQWLGRRKAFACAMIAGAAIVPITCYLPQAPWQLMAMLPAYGFLTFGFHSGFAFYFPELFPTHLRGTGAGFCFNFGRPIAATVLTFSGWIKSRPGMDLREALSLLAPLYLLGLVCLIFLPETRNERLSEVSASA